MTYNVSYTDIKTLISEGYKIFVSEGYALFPEIQDDHDGRQIAIITLETETEILTRVGVFSRFSISENFITLHEKTRTDVDQSFMTAEEILDIFEDEIEELRKYFAEIGVSDILKEIKSVGVRGFEFPESEGYLLCADLDIYLNVLDLEPAGNKISGRFEEKLKKIRDKTREGAE